MTEPEAWTIGRLLSWTADFLKKHGSESPRLEAEVLLAHARGCRRIELYTSFDQPADDDLRTRFRELVKQRSAGAPVSHLTGTKEFYSLSFAVGPAVLTPRPETELLVVGVLDLLKQGNLPCGTDAPRVVDVGTGSGAIAISVAKHSAAAVTAVDKSPAALAVARKNAEAHGLAERIEIAESDLFAAFPDDRQWDVIVSNPPYIPSADIAGLAKEVRDYEPRLALDGGPDGLAVAAALVQQATPRLPAGGWLLFEIGIGQRDGALGLLSPDTWDDAVAVKDLAGIPRVVRARRKPD